ncbi:UNVERIFIED_CONTAM: hypothetical protein K2H54_050169 [Gekko kuhli]
MAVFRTELFTSTHVCSRFPSLYLAVTQQQQQKEETSQPRRAGWSLYPLIIARRRRGGCFSMSTQAQGQASLSDWSGDGSSSSPSEQCSGLEAARREQEQPRPLGRSDAKPDFAAMPVTEKDLAEDAPWKRIQQNTFTRWCNEHLRCVNKRIGNLQYDLSDGLRLIALLEVLSQKRMYRKYHQRPTFRQMQLENVSVALEFLDKENIKLVSIGG